MRPYNTTSTIQPSVQGAFPLLPTRTLFSFQAKWAVALAKDPTGCFFPFFILYIQLPPPSHFAPVLDFYVSYKLPSCAIITIPVSIHDTYTFFPPRFSSLVAVFFFCFGILSICCPLIPHLSGHAQDHREGERRERAPRLC